MKQITANLFQGDMKDAVVTSDYANINVIVYLGQEIPQKLCFNCTPTCLHLPLNDGKNGLEKIRKILFVTYIASLDNKILIACRAGISRSILISTAIYALTNKLSFDNAYKHIKEIIPQSQPELNLLGEVKKITEELNCCL